MADNIGSNSGESKRCRLQGNGFAPASNIRNKQVYVMALLFF